MSERIVMYYNPRILGEWAEICLSVLTQFQTYFLRLCTVRFAPTPSEGAPCTVSTILKAREQTAAELHDIGL